MFLPSLKTTEQPPVDINADWLKVRFVLSLSEYRWLSRVLKMQVSNCTCIQMQDYNEGTKNFGYVSKILPQKWPFAYQ